MTVEIKIPFLGDGITRVTVCSWQRKVGDLVAAGDDLAEIEADKALFHLPSDEEGRLTAILVPEGREAAVGQPVAILERP